MIWQRYVTWTAASMAFVTGIAYLDSVAHDMRAVSLEQLHWDPRVLLVIAALVWLIGSVLIVLLSPQRATAILWVMGLAGVAGVGSGLTGFGLSLALMLSSVLPVFAILSLRSLIVVPVLVTAHIVAALAWGRAEQLTVTLFVGSTVFGLAAWLHREFLEWERQESLFDQARWAASQYAQVNTEILNRMDQGIEIARIRERERIAREVHDTVGYALTASLVQLRAARRLLATSPQSAELRMAHIEEMIDDSLQDVRREVSNLRDESAVRCVGMSRWRRLCEVFAVSTGVRVSVKLTPDLEVVTEEISETIYRIIQESLTNSYRHGGADHVDVSGTWKRSDGLLLVRISDNGRGASEVIPGNGLSGMRERLESLSGTLAWMTRPGRGFDLGIEIPWRGAANGQD